MLDRMVAGSVPAKHHITHHDVDGSLLYEHCFTRKGFDGAYSILYHRKRPHLARTVEACHGWASPEAADPDLPLERRHFRTQDMARQGGPAVDARTVLLFNDDVEIGVAFPSEPDPVYVANGDGDEIVFVLEGTGTLVTPFGTLRYEPLDYVCIPKGVMHRFVPDEGVAQWWQVTTCLGGVGLLPQWRNETGQLRMDAPYCHRDFRRPDFQGPMDEGIRELVVRRMGKWQGFVYDEDHPPLDVVGWDGTVYPWIFPMLNFQPRAGLVHLPPDWHGTFATRGALICSFVPRVVDFHPQAIPCPYPHSSVDCDEFLFYCEGNFTSRKGVDRGSVSFHPYGIPHGPHPGAYEGSIGHARTDETAVMIDTFKPLIPTAAALAIEHAGYHDTFRG